MNAEAEGMNGVALLRVDLLSDRENLPHFLKTDGVLGFVYIVRAYQCRGIDIAIWTLQHESRARLFVSATGPLLFAPPKLELPPRDSGVSGSRSEQIGARINASPDWNQIADKARIAASQTKPFVEFDRSISVDEFRDTLSLATSIPRSCRTMLGKQSEERVVVKNLAGEFSDVRSFEGDDDCDVFWTVTSRLLQKATIANLAEREICIE